MAIYDNSGVDCLVFGEGILAEDTDVTKKSNNLILTNQTGGICVTVKDFFSAEKYYIEQVQFADGIVWTTEQLLEYVQKNATTDTNENNATSYVYGEIGNELLQGSKESDYMVGKTGNDQLSGKAGSDLYFFDLGDGQDTIYEESGMDCIVFGEGIDVADIAVSRNQADLYLTNQITRDQIVINDFFVNSNFFVEQVVFVDGTVWDVDDLVEKARYYQGSEVSETITAYDDDYDIGLEDDYLYGYAGDDRLYGKFGQDALYGDAGNDYLYGGIGEDTLIGGTDDDRLYGEAGADTYIFRLGDGQDVIQEKNGTDRIVFGESIKVEDIVVSRNEKNLYLTNQNNGDKIEIKSFFYNERYHVESVEFADGTIWDIEELMKRATYYYGTEADETIAAYDKTYGLGREDDCLYGYGGNDKISGNMGQDELYGASGNDILYGRIGDDSLSGGTDNDKLYGGAGEDTYLFHLGDGKDVIREESGTDRIVFGEDVNASDILVSRTEEDLYLTNKSTGDKIQLTSFFVNSNYHVENVEFADGTIWNVEQLLDKARYYYGTESDEKINAYDRSYSVGMVDDYLYGQEGDDTLLGNMGQDNLYGASGEDTLYGGTGDDYLYGGTGNDTIKGGSQDDTYVFQLGDGQDIIYDQSGIDRIMFGEGVNASDIVVSRNQNDLYLTNQITGDRITITSFLSNYNCFIDAVEFADGTIWTSEDMLQKVRHYYGSDGNDNIIAYDKMYGVGYEDDFLYGGTGDDRLIGGSGDDTYIFNVGDGNDTIIDKKGTNRIILNGVLEDDIFVEERNGEWYINSQGTSILLSNFKKTDSYLIEFADGTVWTMENILENVHHVSYYSAVDSASSTTTRLGIMIQSMASFEDSTGMMQEDISIIQTEQNNDVANQWWTNEEV